MGVEKASGNYSLGLDELYETVNASLEGCAEKYALVYSVRQADANARIWLFGSRLDDSKKGGDIDIAVLSPLINIPERMCIRRTILDRIGEQKIDIVVSADGNDSFFRLAVETGIRIDE
jgi:predicted nucleotidyltransferase